VKVFEGLLAAACHASPRARELRTRIEESSARIARWKKEREPALRHVVEVPLAVIQQAIALLPPDDADLASFHFDQAGLEGLLPSLEEAVFPR
jgi:hypothetical protein